MAYIDIKHTVWQRYRILDTDLEEFMKLDEKEKHQQVFHKLVDNADDVDWLFDTSEYITPAENSNNSTLEIFDDNDRQIWDNRPIAVKRNIKINEIQNDS